MPQSYFHSSPGHNVSCSQITSITNRSVNNGLVAWWLLRMRIIGGAMPSSCVLFGNLIWIPHAKFEINPASSFRDAAILLNSSDLRSVTQPKARFKGHRLTSDPQSRHWRIGLTPATRWFLFQSAISIRNRTARCFGLHRLGAYFRRLTLWHSNHAYPNSFNLPTNFFP